MHAEYSSLLWKELENKEYRQGYVDAQYSVEMPFQINALRKARGWTQAELADRAGLSRSYISKIEQPGYGSASLKTLKKLCGAFDVALHLTFISFSELVQKSVAFNIETFDVDSFAKDSLYEESLSPPSQNPLHWEDMAEIQTVDFSHMFDKSISLLFQKYYGDEQSYQDTPDTEVALLMVCQNTSFGMLWKVKRSISQAHIVGSEWDTHQLHHPQIKETVWHNLQFHPNP